MVITLADFDLRWGVTFYVRQRKYQRDAIWNNDLSTIYGISG